MNKMLNGLGIFRAINQARAITMERNPINLEFLMSRWSTETHTFVEL